ncbi:conserved hypothetical protein [Pseudarthrobacter chlorophenolicus A6]|uniref:Excalibur domain protein n=1 Tax=Pseudarthrobacter chlorophenolicus (strain ATCC 700700 / DSM 12829 / CIP 107037 / JCM 12360 / KCTC 9906 / NCIMB 13794 / A6) TaxID=452863 RepID=B8HE94_PSECP|nr:hypothetical protein [Pseudarthrobacter chlorophenolicus]ACL39129.1 conserved hypothetical protein [Pseudarthrobacter chlorophenolicus A6]SDR03899.1 hypothetical protein SAMN04489738_4389 [Pseudarthrobacter chlorophenolicus]
MNTRKHSHRSCAADPKAETGPGHSARRHGHKNGVAAAAAIVLLLTGCGGSPASLSAATADEPTSTAKASPTPSATPISGTACASVDSQKSAGGSTYICTKDESGAVVWLEASQSRTVKEKLAAAAAARAAADKAAADKAAADKAASDKAAADKAAADAAAQEAARQAAEAKAAQDAAAAQAAAEAAARAAAAPAPKAVPAAPAAGTGCDPNYSGCVPIASDVDCAGGSGNGPAYVRGPVQVIGSDIYGLDRDGDGFGCE